MAFSTFYKGEPLKHEKKVSPGVFFGDPGDGKKFEEIEVGYFSKGAGEYRVLMKSDTVLAVCTPPPNGFDSALAPSHKKFTGMFGEVVEVVDEKKLYNVSELFLAENRPDCVFSAIREDYNSKIGPHTEPLNIDDLFYLGKESDNEKIYLYDSSERVVIYTLHPDNPDCDDSLMLVNGQPRESFYYSFFFDNICDIIKAILKE